MNRHTLTFTCRARPGQQCELLGDFPHWKRAVAMPEVESGLYKCSVTVGPGVYRYKFRLDLREWLTDHEADAFDSADSYGNCVRVVGGTRPPFFFAPDRRHLAHFEDGRIVIHAEAERSSAWPASVLISSTGADQTSGAAPGAQSLEIPLAVVGERGGRVLLRGVGRIDGTRPGSLTFAGLPEPFALPPPRPPVAQPPAWARQAVFYAVFLDRWHRSTRSPKDPRQSPRDAPSTAEIFFGGDLRGLTDHLDYFEYLGVDALVLTPVHRSPTPHRYDSTDLLTVDPLLGGAPALRELIDAAHRRGLRIIADLAVTHVNDGHSAFQDLLQHQESSPFASWFLVQRFPVVARDTSCVRCYAHRPELPMLDLTCAAAREHVTEAALQLVDFGVDGLRFDAMNDAPEEFWAVLRARVRERNPELLVLGEIVSDAPGRFAEERGVDLATNFPQREAMVDFFGYDRMGAPEFWARTQTFDFRIGAFDPCFRLLFLDNHDVSRFRGPDMPYDRLRLALAYMMLRPEPVALTYGTEFALAGSGRLRRLDDAWSERVPMPALARDATQTQTLIRRLIALRRELAPAQGEPSLVSARGQYLCFDRPTPRGTLRVLLNAGCDAVESVDGLPDAEVLFSLHDSAATPTAPLGRRALRALLYP